ncbi:MAG: SpoIIE family protein phosphatase [Planctomycetia bacterium]|nr:SpoIIE family protein phosphatase [Planctomycetia bacterium]
MRWRGDYSPRAASAIPPSCPAVRLTPTASPVAHRRSPAVPFLELQTNGRRGQRFTIAGPRAVVGRHPGCDIVLDVAAVSRQHAAVTLDDGAVFIEDLRSRNGTLVNGVPLNARRRLEDGDEVSICGQRLVFLASARRRPRASGIVAAPEVEPAYAVLVDSDAVIVSQREIPLPAADDVVGEHAEAKLRALIGLNRALGGSLSLDDVLPRLLDGLLQVFPSADRGFVLLVDPQSGRLVLRARRIKGAAAVAGPLRLSLSLINAVAENRRAILSADASADSRFNANESIVDCRIRSVMCVPVVRSDGSLLGVVQVDSRDVRDGFNEADLEVLAGLAGQASQAVEQALSHDDRIAREQLNRDLELAQRVQQGLLPSRPPDIAGYEIFDFYESARHVGGDFFAYVPLAEGRLAVVLADVSGKGVAAALLMAALSADVRYCLASERDLGSAVAQINESFLRGGWDDRFATLVVAVLDPARHLATICNAGHLPVFLRESSGAVRQVAADLGGLPLGMAGDCEFRSCEVGLDAGAILVFCTDGISEALDHDQRCYGIERLERIMAGPAAGAADLGRRILADVERHAAGQVRSDDICLVCVGRSVDLSGPAHPAQKPGSARRGGRMQAGG